MTALILADKPAGVATHSPDGAREGFVEYLSRMRNEELRVCHRLDKETSGAIIFARTAGAARELADLIERQRMEKTYWLISDGKVSLDDEFDITTHIERRRGSWVSSNPTADGNATSHFYRLRRESGHTLWEVRPRTGKPHQIRLHAEQLGIPVLGDGEHGGSPFPRAMLHALEVRFTSESSGAEIRHQAEAPYLFDNLDLLADGDLCNWLTQHDRRRRLFDLDGASCARLVHEGDVRCDLYGDLCWFYWYRRRELDKGDFERFACLSAEAGGRRWRVQVMGDRGGDPQARRQYGSDDETESWIAQEHGLKYEMRVNQGFSPGLFLDQRQNRLWVKEQACGLRGLNLFSYTAGFSLCAAVGGAREVVSVDSSKSTIEWAKGNFAINGMKSEARIEFWVADARYFLRGCANRNRRFDLVICDPPSFSRGREGVFRVADDLGGLVKQILLALEPSGRALVSTNFEGWDQVEFESVVAAVAGDAEMLATPPAGWDFELPGTERLLKSLVLQKARRKRP